MEKYTYKIGRRKTAVATIRLFPTKGISTINDQPLTDVYPHQLDQRKLMEPFQVAGLDATAYYFTAKVLGGGIRGQLDAIRLGLSRAIASESPELRTLVKRKGLLTRDPRMVERKKTGLHKARKREQYSKR